MNLQDFIEHVKAPAPSCLNAGERRAYFLDPEPPGWCATAPRKNNMRTVTTHQIVQANLNGLWEGIVDRNYSLEETAETILERIKIIDLSEI